MSKTIVIIQGHPDPDRSRFGRVLADAYAQGAAAVGHEIITINVAELNFTLLRTKLEFETGSVPAAIADVQQAIEKAEHIVFFYPLWLCDMPALLKGMLEQVFRPGFGFERIGARMKPRLQGKTARIVVTMGMPAWIYRFILGAHSLRNFKRNLLRVCGIRPIGDSLIGNIEASDPRARQVWLTRLSELGRQAR